MSDDTVDEGWIELIKLLIDAGITKEDFRRVVLDKWLENILK